MLLYKQRRIFKERKLLFCESHGRKYMKLGLSIVSLLKHFTSNEVIDMLAKAGIECVDFPFYTNDMVDPWPFACESEALRRVEELRAYAADRGISFHQAHEPFTHGLGGDKLKCMRIAAALGCKYFVMHPVFTMSYEDFAAYPDKEEEALKEYFPPLAALAGNEGLKVAVENIFGYDSKRDTVYKIAMARPEVHKAVASCSPYLCACLDVGHANIAGNDPAQVVKTLGGSLEVLHVHDSKDRTFEHTVPFLGNIDWQGFMDSLKEIDYKGVFSFEVDNFLNAFPPQLMPKAVRMVGEIGRYMKRMSR